MNRTILASLLLTLVVASLPAQRIPKDFVKTSPPNLRLRMNKTIYLSKGEPTSGPGKIIIDSPRVSHQAQFGEHRRAAVFSTPRNAEEAFERVTWEFWGMLVEDQKTFDAILAVMKKEGLDPTPKLGKFAQEVKLLPAPAGGRRFDVVKKKVPDGWIIEFTAWVMRAGKGQVGTIERFRVPVNARGYPQASKSRGRAYVMGPSLNWQTLHIGPETEESKAAMKKDEEDRARRDRVVLGIYGTGGRKLPLGR